MSERVRTTHFMNHNLFFVFDVHSAFFFDTVRERHEDRKGYHCCLLAYPLASFPSYG